MRWSEAGDVTKGNIPGRRQSPDLTYSRLQQQREKKKKRKKFDETQKNKLQMQTDKIVISATF